MGNPTGIGIDTNQHIFVFYRAGRKWPFGSMPSSYITEKTIVELDNFSGKIINSWGNNLFIMPHGLTVDRSNNVWVTDVGLNQVFKFSHDGKLLLKIGEANVSGSDRVHFDKPTAIAIANDGSSYVSDGYGNSRIIHFSAEGKYLLEWGKKGSSKTEFDTPHGLCLDDDENVYVADRENKRVQVFNPKGNFIKEWHDSSFGRVCAISFNSAAKAFAAVDDATSWFNIEHNGSDVLIFDTANNLINRFGRSTSKSNQKSWYHDVDMDNEGNIYMGDILNDRIQKFRRVANR